MLNLKTLVGEMKKKLIRAGDAYQVGDVVPDVGKWVVLVSGKLLLLLLLPVVLQRREPRPRAVEEVAARAEAALLLGTPL